MTTFSRVMTTLHACRRLYWRIAEPTVVGVRALIVREGRIMLVRHTYLPGYYLPGGKVDRGETAADACCREVAEECSLTVRSSRLLGILFECRAEPQRPHPALRGGRLRTHRGRALAPAPAGDRRGRVLPRGFAARGDHAGHAPAARGVSPRPLRWWVLVSPLLCYKYSPSWHSPLSPISSSSSTRSSSSPGASSRTRCRSRRSPTSSPARACSSPCRRAPARR